MATPAEALKAYENRNVRASYKMQWFGDEVQRGIMVATAGRLDLLAQMLRDRIVANISLPVEKVDGKVVKRSRPGEFPRVETARLMRDIFWNRRGSNTRIVGTSLDYGLWLELKKNRSFLLRTFKEQQTNIMRGLGKKI